MINCSIGVESVPTVIMCATNDRRWRCTNGTFLESLESLERLCSTV